MTDAPETLTGRSVPEWIAKSPDAKIPPHVKARIFTTWAGRCHLSGRKIGPGDAWDCEHRKPLSMGGEHRESNLAPALRDVHRKKTAEEAGPRAKADRMRIFHLGLKKPKTVGIRQWRRFDGTPVRRGEDA